MKIKITRDLYSNRISKKLASNFIELGYGLQVEAMSAEMFFNRSFEPFYAYRHINKVWFDLLEDEADRNSNYETDWSVYDWCHSGYEHNAWFAFPGVAGGKMPITDESTFLIEKSPDYDIHISYVDCDYHGKYAMQVLNNSEIWGGLAQDGKYCFSNLTYHFRGAFKNIERADNIRIEIYKEGEISNPVAVIPIDGIQQKLTVKKAAFKVSEEGRYTFAIVIPPHSKLLCDDFSLMPEDNISGWKKSAVEAGRYIAPGVMRFPGGCFSSFYDWHEGIGKHRKPDYSWFWGGYNYNDVGIDELAQYIEAIGSEGMYCLNVHHPFKRHYEYVPANKMDEDPHNPNIRGANKHHRDMEKFANLENGAQEAANLVEYCNGDETTYWGAKRAENGHKKPYSIKYWEMDNETWRWFHADNYAETCVLYAKKMKEVDPSIKIGIDSYTYSVEELPIMLEIAGKHIDFIADRGSDEDIFKKKIHIIKTYNEKNDTDIHYCNTEWLPLEGVDKANFVARAGGVTKSYMFSKWYYALNAARTLMMWHRSGSIVDFVNFNNWANTHAQCAIETTKEGSFITAAGEILHLFANSKAAFTLKWDGYQPKRTDEFQVQMSLTEEKDALVLHIMNRSDVEEELQIDVSAFFETGLGNGTTLYADNLFAMNTLTKKKLLSKNVVCEVKNGVIAMTAEKYSMSEIIISEGK